MKGVAIAAVAFVAGLALGYFSKPDMRTERVVEVLTRIDTVRVDRPVAVGSRRLPSVSERLCKAECVPDTIADSVLVVVPITQHIYEGEDYRAYVSGHNPALDSITIMRRATTVSTQTIAKPRFSFGLQAGVGYTPRGFQPYIGVGVCLNFTLK